MEEKVEKLLYDRESAAFAISMSIRTVDYLIANKKLRTVRIGRKVLIPAAELRRFAAANHFEPVAGASEREAA
jgi:excisionase family DNA binding protein